MKYGQQFEQESVPEWRLYNIDYNSLKRHIKRHTTRNPSAPSSAVAIPGQPDAARREFEDELFAELCQQHDQAQLFVTSKAEEISRRLSHLSKQVHQLLDRCANRAPVSPKLRVRSAKLRSELARCGNDTQALTRFINAQNTAFRKLLKKYRKWTGSPVLGFRFKLLVFNDPKSFTQRDLGDLYSLHDSLLAALSGMPTVSSEAGQSREPVSRPPAPSSAPPRTQTKGHVGGKDVEEHYESATTEHRRGSPSGTKTPSSRVIECHEPSDVRYWNEYENGSDVGDLDGQRDSTYGIYVIPDDDGGDTSFAAWWKTPLSAFQSLFAPLKSPSRRHRRRSARDETQPLLTSSHTASRSHGYFTFWPRPSRPAISSGSSSSSSTDVDTEIDSRPMSPSRPHRWTCASTASDSNTNTRSCWLPTAHRPPHPINRTRERHLLWAVIGSFATASLLLLLACVLLSTGRHKLKTEVDVVATVSVVASMAWACIALGLAAARRDGGGWMGRATVWITFVALCVLNGGLLVLVVRNTTAI